jgi:hypothetical protein
VAITIVPETGSGSDPTANSYDDLTFVRAYAADRRVELDEDDEVVKGQMIHAMDYLLNYTNRWKGDPVFPGVQPLDWPREGVYIETFYVPIDSLPVMLKRAQAQLVIEQHNGAILMPSTEPGLPVVKEKVDVIETEYASPVSIGGIDWTQPSFPAVDVLLMKLIEEGGFTLRTVRI